MLYEAGLFFKSSECQFEPLSCHPNEQTDSLKSAMFINAMIFNGEANDAGADHIFGFQGKMHKTNQFSVFQTYYGASLTMGSYHVADYYHYTENYGYGYPYDTAIHVPGQVIFSEVMAFQVVLI